MNFKSMISCVAASVCLQAFAGQVYSLQSGQTMPLSNGDVVACMGTSPASAPRVTVTCTLVTGLTSTNGVSLPMFKGTATEQTEEAAKREALDAARTRCRNFSAGMSFSFDGRYVDPCSDSESIPGQAYFCN